MAGNPVDDDSIIGDECHIVSAATNGPRYDPDFPDDQLDDYSNLLLLCKVHHKLIDDHKIHRRLPEETDSGARNMGFLAKDVTNLGRGGNGDVEVGLDQPEELPYVMGLVRQAFEKQMGNAAAEA